MDKAAEVMWQPEDSPGKTTQEQQEPDDGDKAEVPGQPAHSKDKPPQSQTLQWETLGRQFVEYEQVAPFLIPEEQQRRLLDFLPLFLEVCSCCLWCRCQGCELEFCFCVGSVVTLAASGVYWSMIPLSRWQLLLFHWEFGETVCPPFIYLICYVSMRVYGWALFFFPEWLNSSWSQGICCWDGHVSKWVPCEDVTSSASAISLLSRGLSSFSLRKCGCGM